MSTTENLPQSKLLNSEEAATLEDLLNQVAIEYSSQSELAALRIEGAQKFGHVLAFLQDELDQLRSLCDLIVDYASEKSPPRPLCLAVFGPPGSGKSFAVEQICAEAERLTKERAHAEGSASGATKLDLESVNLTQIAHANDLAKLLACTASAVSEQTLPVVFFDEFDAAREGAPFGWLSWFLAPMHDGAFMHEGELVKLKRAVYVFAGGTADTLAEFSARLASPASRSAKGSDFVSRLRGYLDVQGPNADPRFKRRAVLLRSELARRAKRNGAGSFAAQRDLIESLLHVGRYRHGARSITAIVELSALNPKQSMFGWEELPQDHLLQLHIDRGPLDTRLIGGSIALSGHPSTDGAQRNSPSGEFSDPLQYELTWSWIDVAKVLWDLGATLAYAGGWGDNTDGQLMGHLLSELRKRRIEPWRSPTRRAEPAPWLENFVKHSSVGLQDVDRAVSPDERTRLGLRAIISDYLSQDELSRFTSWQSRAVERFRRRLDVTESSVARFAVGGAIKGHDGRMPGVIEELMLTLASNSPIYLAGGFGGATRDAGSILGLAYPRTGSVPAAFQPLSSVEQQELEGISSELRPSPWPRLPVTPTDIAEFFREHAFGRDSWPDNGLTVRENRLLFESTSSTEISQWVRKGLLQRFALR
jgi:hypothetical protein